MEQSLFKGVGAQTSPPGELCAICPRRVAAVFPRVRCRFRLQRNITLFEIVKHTLRASGS